MTGDAVRSKLSRLDDPDPSVLAFNARLEALLAGAPAPWDVPIEAIRQFRAEGKGAIPVHGPLPEATWVDFDPSALGPAAAPAAEGPRRLRLIEPEAETRAVVVHLHGGGWTFGASDLADGRCLRLARALDALSVSVPYRLAPENPWPACADDALAGTLWALEEAKQRGGAPVFITGESAGAHLAAVAMLRIRDLNRLGEIRAAAFTYGCFDLRMTPSMRNWGARNLILSTPIVDWFLGNLMGEDAERLAKSPAVSPLLAELGGMPPALFQVGTQDPLLDDSLFMAERWRVAGGDAELVLWPGAAHGFDYFDRPEDGLPIALESQLATATFFASRM